MALTTVPASLSATALTLTTAAQPNITSVGTLTGLTVSGNIAGTLTTAAQTNITSLGTLTSLNSTGDVTVTSGTSGKPHLNLINTNADSSAPVLNFKKDSASPADNDEVGRIYMWGDDDAGNPTEAFLAIGKMTDVSNGSEDSSLDLYTLAAGAQSATLTLKEGKVGIGTASPGNKLDIKGTVGFEATNSTNRWLAYTYTDNTYRLNYNGAGADEVVVDSSGRVGIGTSSPSSYYAKNFVVMADGDGTGGITIAAPATDDNTYLAFADGTSGAATYAGYVGYSHSSEYLFFGAGATTAIYVKSGNLGIGASSPAAAYGSDTVLEVSGASSPGIVINDTGQAQKYGIHADSNDLKITYGSGVLVDFQNDGNVGIGTTSPAQTLHVSSTGATSNGIRISNSEGSFDARVDQGEFYLYDVDDNRIPFLIDTSGNVLLGTSNTTWASQEGVRYFNGDSLVLTRSAGDALYVNRLSSDGPIASFYKDGSAIGYLSTSGGDLLIHSTAANHSGLRFGEGYIFPTDNSGNTSNGVMDLGLSVSRYKDLYLSNSIDISKTTAGNITGGASRAGAVLRLHHEAQWENGYTGGDFLGGIEFSTGDGSTGEGVRAAIKTSVDSYYNTNKMRFYVAASNNATLTERMQIKNDGSVGVGTTDPEYRLQINGSNVSSGGGLATVGIFDEGTAYNGTKPGGGIAFRGKYNSSGNITNFGSIQAFKENATNNQYGSAMVFTTRAHGGNLTETLRIRSDKSVSLNDGHLIMSNGYGIQFNATANSAGTMSSETLDDYEEGTWTPVIRASGGNTVTGQSNVQATYTKIGRLVQISAYISSVDMTLMTSGTYVIMQGLPFACTTYGDFNISYRRGGTAFQGGYVQTGTSYLYFVDDNGAEINQSNNQTMTAFMINATYMAS